MRILSKPELKESPERIFEICVESYRDENRRNLLLRCKDMVQIDSTKYEELIPSRIDQFCMSELPESILANDLVEVYKQKFAKKNSPGRKYYNQIRSLAEDGCCPICGILPVTTLDHYLPKSKVPTLSVTAINLIPACRHCNTEKQSAIHLYPNETPVHLYLDSIYLSKSCWLYAEIGSKLEVIYYICCPDTWEQGVRSRVEKHLDFYNLHELYTSFAVSEISNMKYYWKSILKEPEGLEELKAHFMIIRESAEKNDLNSWKAALYRGLEKSATQVCEQLRAEDLSESNSS